MPVPDLLPIAFLRLGGQGWREAHEETLAGRGTGIAQEVETGVCRLAWIGPRLSGLGLGATGVLGWLLRGSDIGLGTSGEDIDAVSIEPDGDVIFSTRGGYSRSGVMLGANEDLFRWVPATSREPEMNPTEAAARGVET